jgi:hypothetical protein
MNVVEDKGAEVMNRSWEGEWKLRADVCQERRVVALIIWAVCRDVCGCIENLALWS